MAKQYKLTPQRLEQLQEELNYLKTVREREVAEQIYERHQFFSEWLIRLGVDEKTATEDACKMEHYMSAESFAAIKKYVHIHGMESS